MWVVVHRHWHRPLLVHVTRFGLASPCRAVPCLAWLNMHLYNGQSVKTRDYAVITVDSFLLLYV
jgi:hypothetical protein